MATELDGMSVAIKSVDSFKQPEMLDQLQAECAAYTVLMSLQGDCIPILVRPAPVMLWEGLLDGIVLSLVTGRTLEAMGDDGIASIPRACRQRSLQDLDKIHKLGVLHGDIADRNLILHEVEGCPPRIVFVDFGFAETNCSANDVRFKGEVYNLCRILQLFGKMLL
ncbi:Aste57867_2481 [Aphanomyces stellatus]|uniref:Aste57867_2481 protein n=1 Tax=Aphanomyces stellatus TaxID=120398 RepID=A0A485K943_9STRA|nr:hypothetical protein As57867_002475 [Aphanomyces stellatus]VFT79680.1 Aste57867_2481 [Aphanomyces stellatus]